MLKLIHPLETAPVVHYVNIVEPGMNVGDLWPRRSFVDFQMLLLIDGAMRYTFHDTGEEFVLKPGGITFISPGELNSQELIPPERKSFFACVHFLLSHDRHTRTNPAPPRLSSNVNLNLFSTLFKNLYDAFHASGQYSSAIASGIAREIYLRLLEPESAMQDGSAAKVKEMTEFLDCHLTAHYGRKELAKKFHLAPEYINQLFQKYMGISPGNYVHQKIAQEGYRILRRENLSVKECAIRLGFKNQFHFSRVFRKEYGIPPSMLHHH